MRAHRSFVSTRKDGGYYGFKLHPAVYGAIGLPVVWTVETASAAEPHKVMPLIDTAKGRGLAVATAAMDRGYDVRHVYDGCEERECGRSSRFGRPPASRRAGTRFGSTPT